MKELEKLATAVAVSEHIKEAGVSVQDVLAPILFGLGGAGTAGAYEYLTTDKRDRKKKQFDAIHPDAIVSACSNCRIHLEDGLEEYDMGIPVLSLTETIAEHLAGSEQPGSKE